MKEIRIDYTKAYMKDLRKFSPPEKRKIDMKIARLANLYLDHPSEFYGQVTRMDRFLSHASAMDSSLYIYRLDRKIRLIFTADEDPLFGQLLITLFRIVRPDNLQKALRSIASSLYQSLQFPMNEVENDG